MSKIEDRLTRVEMGSCKLIISLVNCVVYEKKELERILTSIPDGTERFDRTMNDMMDILQDICNVIPEKQMKALRNSAKDMKVRLVPAMLKENIAMQLDKESYKALIDCARERCKFCVLDGKECTKCDLYNVLIAQVPLDDYGDGIVCPYAFEEWAE